MLPSKPSTLQILTQRAKTININVPPEEITAQIDVVEHDIYKEIDRLLAIPNIFGTEAVDSLVKLDNILDSLLKLRMKYPFPYFKEINMPLVPSGHSPETFMKQQYIFFMEKCLDVSEMSSDELAKINAYVLQIISRPAGQRLILRLNHLAQTNGCKIKAVSILGYGSMAASADPASRQTSIPKIPHPSGNPYKQFHELTPYTKTTLLTPTKPRSFIDKLDFGKSSAYSYKPTFISFSHELIHCLHFFRGTDRLRMPFSAAHQSTIIPPIMTSPEELWTIDMGRNLSENKIRQEHDLKPRFSHNKTGFLAGKYLPGIAQAEEIQPDIQAALKV
jgi:hypothetical protein